MAGIAVALSGGGHRAALFGLGALLYLVDAGKNAEVTSIASVSGGSLANAFVAQDISYRAVSSADFDRQVAAFARQLARPGTLWAYRGTWLYLVVLVVALAPAVLVWWLPWSWPWRFLLCALWLLIWAKGVAERRGEVAGRAFAATLYRRNGRPTKLRDTHRENIDHVICATDLHAGEHMYFSSRFVYAYRFGWGEPGDLPLHVAVQASAAFPGAFPPRWLRSARHAFHDGAQADAHMMALSDGGVYDNMADQWPQRLGERRRSPGAPAFEEPAELVAVNASAGLGWRSLRRLQLPALGELLALLRVTDVIYDNSTSLRRRGLVARFDEAEQQGHGLRGALVHIERSPLYVPTMYRNADAQWPERAGRARAALNHLAGENAEEWEAAARANSVVATTLTALGRETSARLLHHGYLLAMTNLHVILGYPLLPAPVRQRFDALVR